MIFPIPPSITESTEIQGTLLTCRWKKNIELLISLIVFTLCWDIMIGAWLISSHKTFDTALLTISILPLTIGISLTYLLLCRVLNQTHILISSDRLVIKSTPLPFWGNKNIPRQQIAHLFCVQKNLEINGRYTAYFNLYYLNAHKEKQALIKRLYSDTEALFVKQRLETLLGIDPQPIPGEYQG